MQNQAYGCIYSKHKQFLQIFAASSRYLSLSSELCGLDMALPRWTFVRWQKPKKVKYMFVNGKLLIKIYMSIISVRNVLICQSGDVFLWILFHFIILIFCLAFFARFIFFYKLWNRIFFLFSYCFFFIFVFSQLKGDR